MGQRFNPMDDAHKSSFDDEDGGGFLTVAGDFMAFATKLEDTESRNGNRLLKLHCRVIGGAHDGAYFRAECWIHKAPMWQLRDLCFAIHGKEAYEHGDGPEFDLDDIATVEPVLLHHPFKVRTKTRKGNDGNTYCEVDKYYYLDRLTPQERKFMGEWSAHHDAEMEQGGPPQTSRQSQGGRQGGGQQRSGGGGGRQQQSRGGYGGGGGYGRSNGSGGGGRGRPQHDDAPMPEEDDIPF